MQGWWDCRKAILSSWAFLVKRQELQVLLFQHLHSLFSLQGTLAGFLYIGTSSLILTKWYLALAEQLWKRGLCHHSYNVSACQRATKSLLASFPAWGLSLWYQIGALWIIFFIFKLSQDIFVWRILKHSNIVDKILLSNNVSLEAQTRVHSLKN